MSIRSSDAKVTVPGRKHSIVQMREGDVGIELSFNQAIQSEIEHLKLMILKLMILKP